eukprot:COSAG06_NODE_31_length_31488_cov_60.882793_8_plen_81_part_00
MQEHTLQSLPPGEDAGSGLRRVHIQQLNWADEAAISDIGMPIDLLLGADLLYNHEAHDALADTIDALSGAKYTSSGANFR